MSRLEARRVPESSPTLFLLGIVLLGVLGVKRHGR